MSKHIVYVVCWIALLPNFTTGQTLSDALRYSTYRMSGTSRNMGMGGGLFTIGADLSSVAFNPAGTATFRKSRISFTPLTSYSNIRTIFNGEVQVNRDLGSSLVQAGFVAVAKPIGSDWKLINFTIAYNQLNNFRESYQFSGQKEGSITDRWLEQSQGLSPAEFNPFEEGLAAETGALILVDSTPWHYTTDYQDYNYGKKLEKNQSINTRGTMSRISMQIAGNYLEKLQIGMGLNIDFVFYRSNKNYSEQIPLDGNISVFNDLQYSEQLYTGGSGINVSLGAIFRPIQPLFLSLSLTTPTFWSLNDNYASELKYTYRDQDQLVSSEAESPEGNFGYGLKTPSHFRAGGGYLFGRSGMLVLHAEWVKYTSARFNLTKESNSADIKEYQSILNRDLTEAYRSTLNLGIGGEYARGIWRWRSGVTLQQRPYANDIAFDRLFSLGAGVNFDSFFLDLAYSHQVDNSGYTPYLTKSTELFPLQVVEVMNRKNSWNLTLGWRL